jgi:hypothetical protein
MSTPRPTLKLAQAPKPSVPDNWHREGTFDHPHKDSARVVHIDNGPDRPPTVGVYEASQFGKGFHVTGVQAVTRGGGRAAMEHLTAKADQHGVPLSLAPTPIDPSGAGLKMKKLKLQAWYRGFGFSKPNEQGLMTREPQAPLQKGLAMSNKPPRFKVSLAKVKVEEQHPDTFNRTATPYTQHVFHVHDTAEAALQNGVPHYKVSVTVKRKTPGLHADPVDGVGKVSLDSHIGQNRLTPAHFREIGKQISQQLPGVKAVQKDVESYGVSRMTAGARAKVKLGEEQIASLASRKAPDIQEVRQAVDADRYRSYVESVRNTPIRPLRKATAVGQALAELRDEIAGL